MKTVDVPLGPGRTIQQARSRRTYDALIAAGFKLLRQSEFELITIARIADAAGYSVGAFYARFNSKDEFFEAMVARHLQERTEAQKRLLADAPHDELIRTWIEGIVKYYWKRRAFWRAVLMRSTNDPEFWTPIDHNARTFVNALTARIASDSGRPLTESESTNVRFAIHMVLSMINNRIVNRPRPSLIGSSTFVDNLSRAFLLISDFDRLGKGI
jgi:AcrR family transcriptional regulator